MNGTYPQSPEQYRQTPPSVGERLRVTGLAELLIFTATNKYVKAPDVHMPFSPLPETSAKHVALDQTVEFTPTPVDPVAETPARMPAFQAQELSTQTREEMLADARSQIKEIV